MEKSIPTKNLKRKLDGRIAVVTGGAKGIGYGISSVLASEGAKVIILDVDEKASKEAVKEIQTGGGEAFSLKVDVTNLCNLQLAAQEVEKIFGEINILCCNTGIYPAARLEDMEEKDWDLVHNVNLKGMFFSIKAFLPLLKKGSPSKIVLTSSITGPVTGYPGWSHYGATKAGMLGFMRSAALELAKYSININAVLPGNILTGSLEQAGEEYLKQMTRAIPLKRLGKPEDIGKAVLFLASSDSDYITGQTIIVDGGQTLPESIEAVE